eukprot:CAMPEP_0197465948 /NCGR_PEP_ID=MMETSP1175-20131217/64800_1 /TAXON_ID=1003142 /ORGANISM="Triceratium dubium, Strain CCMP147" /LENGTH=181 /DNA_ID=CAMNT_0043001975 /DNA_START=343 /DNA_END=888 /DNA_ORIENTATION=+
MRMRAASSAPNAAFGVDLRRAAASHNGNNKEGDLPQPVWTPSFRVLVRVSPETAKCSTNLLCVPHSWSSARAALDRSLGGSMRMRAASSAPNAAFGVDLRRAAASHTGNNKEGDLPQPVRTRSFRVLVHVSPESAKCSTNLLCVPHFWPSARGALDRSLAMGSTPPNNLLSASRLYVRLRD